MPRTIDHYIERFGEELRLARHCGFTEEELDYIINYEHQVSDGAGGSG